MKTVFSMDDATLACALRTDGAVSFVSGMIEREMRALWAAAKNVEILSAIERFGAWYRDEPDARLPDPFLSAVMRPAGDGDKGGAHRILSLAREIRKGQPADLTAFVFYRVTSYLVLERLGGLFAFPEIDEMRRQQDEAFAFLEHSGRSGYDEETFSRIVKEKAASLVRLMETLSDAVAREERLRLGGAAADPYARKALGLLEGIDRKADRMLAKTKTTPASSRVGRWVWERWCHYSQHPEACSSDVSRRRVYVKDVWEAEKATARSVYGIADLAAFRRILATYRRARNRRNDETAGISG